MKPIAIWLTLLTGITGCGHRAKIEYVNADHQRIETIDASAQRAGHRQFTLEVAADVDRQPSKATEAEVATPGPASTIQPERNPVAVTIFIGGVHFNGDTVIEAGRTVPSKAGRQRDERCERLRRQHEERVADWLSRFN